jgi:hypothetical protein
MSQQLKIEIIYVNKQAWDSSCQQLIQNWMLGSVMQQGF